MSNQQQQLRAFTGQMLPTTFGNFNISAATQIGRRSNQEDRFVYSPDLFNGEYAFFGVFDGTVKEHASEWVHTHILPIFVQSPSFQAFHQLSSSEKQLPKHRYLLENAFKECYAETDRQLIEWCAERKIDYSACTSITVLIHIPTDVMYVAHLGDSHVGIGLRRGQPGQEQLLGYSLTKPHKPDQQRELQRIEAAGGCLTYLHGNKPFIRGGDFGQRHHAMQLNYSRAFGGKDLKMYGLSAEPDVIHLELQRWRKDKNARAPKKTEEHKETSGNGIVADGYAEVILLGSDGLWDVVSPTDAVNVAVQVQEEYEREQGSGNSDSNSNQRPMSAPESLVQLALLNHESKGSNDNVTVIAVFLQ